MRPLDLLYIPIALALAPFMVLGRRKGWRERMGLGPALPPPPPGRKRILIHAVSVGEVNALRSLVPLLETHADVVVSTTTDTGTNQAKSLYGEHRVVRYPLDLSFGVCRFLDRVRPDAVALTELELWPNFAAICAKRRVPLAVINGRLSERSARGYRKLGFIMRRAFRSLAFAAVQDAQYARHFEEAGVEPSNCLLTGTMKWDIADRSSDLATLEQTASAIAQDLGIDPSRPLVIAASTSEGEERLIAQAFDEATSPDNPSRAQLLCAPRRPQRFDQAAADLEGCVRRSSSERRENATRFLLDSIGELSSVYLLADVVIMGRTFIPLGGSDPIEPASLGKPVLMGPHTENFRAVTDALAEEGGIERVTEASLPETLKRLLQSEHERDIIARGATRVIERSRGASARHAELLLDLAGVTPRK